MKDVRKACVIGWPIEHSRSPLLHGYWLKFYGIEGEYRREAVAPGELSSFLESFASRGFTGGNVTIPHKEAVFSQVRIADELTAKLGSVNTLYLEGGELCGTSTDGYGFIANLLQSIPDFQIRGSRVLVLGAGGASRSIVGALAQAGAARISVANRSPERSLALARAFGSPVEASHWNRIESQLGDIDLLVNATSLGMVGKEALALDLSLLPASAIVSDIVYTPLVTPLLDQAQRRGLRVADGLGMLLHQAVPGFERWFGVRPEVTAELRALLEADIGA